VNPPPSILDSPRAAEPELSRWFVEQVRPHEPALKSWLRARFPWLGEVDDIAQEAAFRLWRRQTAANAAPLASPKAALFTIARHAVVDLARRRAVANTGTVSELERLEAAADGENVVAKVVAREELEFFAEALRRLPSRCRQVVTLAKVYGMSEREVAERLGVSETTIRTQIVRGMERCTEYLRQRGVVRGTR